MRLNRFLAAAGLGSRRGVESLITDGRVKVNGRVVEDLATQVTERDVVKVGQRVVRQERALSVLLYKPRGYLVTANDEQGRRTIYNCLPPDYPRLFHVGRLDQESEGLLLMTNDGDLSLALTHPRYKVEKEYEVMLDRAFDPSHREKLLRGFHIIGGRAKMESVQQTGEKKLRIVLRQGIKRQIRLMLYEMGYEVMRLCRMRIGTLRIEEMRPGEYRLLTTEELALLRRETAKAAEGAAASPRGADEEDD